MQKVTLTFDNGPTPGVTEQVLKILDTHDIKASFWVLGKNLANPGGQALLADIAAAGHWVGNHSLTHSVAFGDRPDAEYVAYEIGETQRRIGSYAHPEKLFRPFGNSGKLGSHLFSEASLAYLVQHEFTCVLWNSIPRDWADHAGWVERGLDQVIAYEWAVTVLHDIPHGGYRRLEEFILRLKDAGISIMQEFPDSVVPIKRGRIVLLPDDYIAGRVGRTGAQAERSTS